MRLDDSDPLRADRGPIVAQAEPLQTREKSGRHLPERRESGARVFPGFAAVEAVLIDRQHEEDEAVGRKRRRCFFDARELDGRIMPRARAARARVALACLAVSAVRAARGTAPTVALVRDARMQLGRGRLPGVDPPVTRAAVVTVPNVLRDDVRRAFGRLDGHRQSLSEPERKNSNFPPGCNSPLVSRLRRPSVGPSKGRQRRGADSSLY